MNRLSLDPRRFALAIRVPAVVALFLIVVSAILTNAVLTRLQATQERHLRTLSTTHLNGLASVLVPYVLRDDTWEIFDAIERAAILAEGFGQALIIVTNARGETLASSVPRLAPIGSRQDERAAAFEAGDDLRIGMGLERAYARRDLVHQGRTIGTVHVEFSVAHLLTERNEVLRTLVATNAAIALTLALLGYWVVRRMLRPLSLLSQRLEAGASGAVQPISAAELQATTSEYAPLFARFNAMATAVNEREALAKELAHEERLASLGRLASGMAHEINNPLGGLFNAIDTLKAHGDKVMVRRSSVDLIERGLKGIRDVVRSALATYRADRDPRRATAEDFHDLKFLVRPEANRRSITLGWHVSIESPCAPAASALRQVVLNLLLNAIQATAEGGRVELSATRDPGGSLEIEVHDEGPGFGPEARAALLGETALPNSVQNGSGLGLWVTHRLTSEAGGEVEIETSPLGGALVRLRFPSREVREVRHVA